jgi:transposase-like protein
MTNTQAMVLRQALGRGEVGQGKRYPVGAKERVIAFALGRRRQGLTWSAIANELGIHFETLRCWCIKAGAKPTRMRAVHVVEAVAERTVSVVSPNGYRVPEISLEEAMALLRALG